MSEKEVEDGIIVNLLDLEHKFKDIAEVCKETARYMMKLRKIKEKGK